MTREPTPSRPVKLTAPLRDRRRRGRVTLRALGIEGPPPFDALREVRAEPPGRVLTVAIDVDARRGEALDPGWRLRFRETARRAIEACPERTEATILGRLVRWVDGQLGQLPTTDVRRGIFLVATDAPRRLELFTLPRPVADRFSWSAAAELEPLEELAAAYPPTGIVFMDGRLARLVTTRLGDVVAETAFWFDLDTSAWRRMEGRAPGALAASGATHTDRYARRVEVAEAHWVRHLGSLVREIARRDGWTRAILNTVQGFEVVEDLDRWAGVPVVRHLRQGWAGKPIAALVEAILDELAAERREGAPRS